MICFVKLITWSTSERGVPGSINSRVWPKKETAANATGDTGQGFVDISRLLWLFVATRSQRRRSFRALLLTENKIVHLSWSLFKPLLILGDAVSSILFYMYILTSEDWKKDKKHPAGFEPATTWPMLHLLPCGPTKLWLVHKNLSKSVFILWFCRLISTVAT